MEDIEERKGTTEPSVKITDGETLELGGAEEEDISDDDDQKSRITSSTAAAKAKQAAAKPVEKIQYQDDSKEFKDRLMQLVTKG